MIVRPCLFFELIETGS